MSSETGWWTDFFSGPVLDTVRSMWPADVTRQECDFLIERLSLEHGALVLDVPCGAGRHAIELARRGMRVTGVDASSELIADARTAAAGLDAGFDVRDMRDLPWSERFDAVVCLGNSFAYLDDDGNAAFLAAVRASLKPGGRFMLETALLAESVLANPLRRSWYEFGGRTMLHDPRYDPAAGTLTSRYGFVGDDEVEWRTAEYQVYLHRELCAMLRAAGLTPRDTWGSTNGDAFALGSRTAYVLSVRESES